MDSWAPPTSCAFAPSGPGGQRLQTRICQLAIRSQRYDPSQPAVSVSRLVDIAAVRPDLDECDGLDGTQGGESLLQCRQLLSRDVGHLRREEVVIRFATSEFLGHT